VLAAALAIALAAGAVRGITGFGGALVMTPPLALLLGPAIAVPVALLLESVAAAPMVAQTRRQMRLAVVGPILATACATVPLGAWVLGARAAWTGLALAPCYYAGLVAGARLYPRLSDTRFRQFTLWLLIAVSAAILLA
jgi:uncharacterized membrane protein YfcA